MLIYKGENSSLFYDIEKDSFIYSSDRGEFHQESREIFLSLCTKKTDSTEDKGPYTWNIPEVFITQIPPQFWLVDSVICQNADSDTPSLFYKRGKPYVKKCTLCGKIHEFLFTIKGEFVCIDCLPLVSTCVHCGKIVKNNSRGILRLSDGIYCKECVNELFQDCPICGKKVKKKNFISVTRYSPDGLSHDTIEICPNCERRGYTPCQECGKHFSSHVSQYVSNVGTVCPECLESDKFSACDECGGYHISENLIYDDEEDKYLCDECYQRKDQVIHGHWSKLKPVFHGTDSPLFFGIEQEIDDGCNQQKTAKNIITALTKNNLYIETDGSLNSSGLELVYFPRTWREWQNFKPELEKVYNIARENDYKAHETSTCGLHIHASRNAITSPEFPDIDENIGKIIALYENNYSEFLKFSRRKEEDLNQWAKRNSYRLQRGEPKKSLAMEGKGNRYRAVNVEPNETIEFRFFRGSLLPGTVLASINLVYNMIKKATSTNSSDIDLVNFADIVDLPNSPIIGEYLETLKGSRRICVS